MLTHITGFKLHFLDDFNVIETLFYRICHDICFFFKFMVGESRFMNISELTEK